MNLVDKTVEDEDLIFEDIFIVTLLDSVEEVKKADLSSFFLDDFEHFLDVFLFEFVEDFVVVFIDCTDEIGLTNIQIGKFHKSW